MTRNDNQRRPSAIPVADVVGYSRIMGEDQMGIPDRLKPGFLSKRREWKPFRNDERNQRIFAGTVRHGPL